VIPSFWTLLPRPVSAVFCLRNEDSRLEGSSVGMTGLPRGGWPSFVLTVNGKVFRVADSSGVKQDLNFSTHPFSNRFWFKAHSLDASLVPRFRLNDPYFKYFFLSLDFLLPWKLARPIVLVPCPTKARLVPNGVCPGYPVTLATCSSSSSGCPLFPPLKQISPLPLYKFSVLTTLPL